MLFLYTLRVVDASAPSPLRHSCPSIHAQLISTIVPCRLSFPRRHRHNPLPASAKPRLAPPVLLQAMDDDQPPAQAEKGDKPIFQWSGTGHAPAEDHDSPSGDEDDPQSPHDTKVPAPVQKRRRVTRACDECRRKKIKCDGKQPCTHCTVYSYGW